MKPIKWFPAFFLASSLFFTGCYTHLATSGSGYYVYHPRPVYSDTLRPNSAKEIVTYDTTMHGDTMFIDEHRVEATQQGNGLAQSLVPNGNGTTIVNNYYGSGSYWNDYWGPSWGFSVGFGWPYYNSWYSPWWPYYYTPNYYTDWWAPYGYFGYYPPVYDCFAPYYGFGYPYYPYYGYRHHFYADYDEDGNGYYNNIRPGRIGGEHRVGQMTGRQSTPGSIIAHPAPPSMVIARSSLAESTGTELAQSHATEVLQSAEDRNAPVHVLSPDAEATRSEAPVVRATSAPENVTAPAVASSTPTSSHPIIVRRMDNGQTITSTTANRAGREMVVVRRSSGYNAAASYRSSYGGNGSSSRSYAPSERSYGNYSAPARSYSPPERSYSPPERSYSPPERSYSPPEQNSTPREQSYSPPERSYSPPERSAPAESSGRSNGGGSEGRAGGGGEGRAR